MKYRPPDSAHKALEYHTQIKRLWHKAVETSHRPLTPDEQKMVRTLDKATTYYVDGDIMYGLLTGPARTIPLDTRITPDMFPTKQGVILFGITYSTAELSKHNYHVGGLMWETDHETISPYSFNGPSVAVMISSLCAVDWLKAVPSLSPEFYCSWRFQDTLKTAIRRSCMFADDDTRKDDPEGDVAKAALRVLATFLLFIQQELLEVHKQPPRDMPRVTGAVPTTEPPTVNIIRLRRVRHDTAPTDHRNVQWNYQWMVRGHWRQQPYGPGRTQTHTIWINPYTKGPDDKPLRVRTDVFAIER